MTQPTSSSSLSPKSGGLQEIARKAALDYYDHFPMPKPVPDWCAKALEPFILRAIQSVAQPLEEKIKILEGNKDHPRPESHRDSDT
jgi:hypothetical protein